MNADCPLCGEGHPLSDPTCSNCGNTYPLSAVDRTILQQAAQGMSFFLDEVQTNKARAFVEQEDAKAFARQVAACEECKQFGSAQCHRHCTGYPYYGAIGGATTYTFTPTSLGTVVKVKRGEVECDLSDYEDW